MDLYFEPCFVRKYSNKKRCRLADCDFDSLTLFTCAYCMSKHMDEDETQDWLRRPTCMRWYYEACFHYTKNEFFH